MYTPVLNNSFLLFYSDSSDEAMDEQLCLKDYNITSSTILHCMYYPMFFMLVVRPMDFTNKDKEVIPEDLVNPSLPQSTTEAVLANRFNLVEQQEQQEQQEQITQPSLTNQSAVELTKKSEASGLTSVSSACTSILTALCLEKVTVYLTWNKLLPFEFATNSLLSEVFNTFMKTVLPKEDATQYCLVKHLQPNSILPMDKTLAELLIYDKTVFASMLQSLLYTKPLVNIDW